MNWPQRIAIALIAVNLVIAIWAHGTPRTGHNRAWPAFIAAATWVGVLAWGGFFRA